MLLLQVSRTAQAPEKQEKRQFSREQLALSVREAGIGLEGWLHSKSAELGNYGRPINVAFGPALHCYRYRVETPGGIQSNGVGALTPEKLAHELGLAMKFGIPLSDADAPFAKKWGIPADKSKIASEQENSAIFRLNADARIRDGSEHGRVYFVKHLFEPDASFENTEFKQVSYPFSLSELANGPAKQFSDLFSSKTPPQGAMSGHACFPAAEAELKLKYPSILSLLPSNPNGTPVSLSPHFTKFIREELKFGGILVSDSEGMGALQDYFGIIAPLLPSSLKKLSSEALFFVLSASAGVNWPLVHGIDAPMKKELREFYSSEPDLKSQLDALSLQSLFLKLRAMNSVDPLVSGLSLSDLSAPAGSLSQKKQEAISRLKEIFGSASDEFEARLYSIASHDGKMPYNASEHANLPPQVLSVLKFYSEWADLWSRGGIINVEFRKKIVESLTGGKFPEPEKFGSESEWLSALFANKEFSSAYNSIDWNGAAMRGIFQDYANELATGMPASRIERMKPLVPRKLQ